MNRKWKKWVLFPILIFILFYLLGALYFKNPVTPESLEIQTVESLEDFVLNFEDKVEEEVEGGHHWGRGDEDQGPHGRQGGSETSQDGGHCLLHGEY